MKNSTIINKLDSKEFSFERKFFLFPQFTLPYLCTCKDLIIAIELPELSTIMAISSKSVVRINCAK